MIRMYVSTDGGQNWVKADEVRVAVDGIDLDNPADTLYTIFTHEGVIRDLVSDDVAFATDSTDYDTLYFEEVPGNYCGLG